MPGADESENAPPVVPGYELLRVLGRGGMGVVWEAIEQRFERRVALKVHAAGGTASPEDLQLEARLAARIADPGVVRVYDAGLTLEGAAYFTMELVDGRDLAAVLEDGPLPPARAVLLLTDIARAVGAAHALGITHRDLKTKNIMVDRGGRARVLDFGVAVHEKDGAAAALSGLSVGTPPYMSPEQIQGLRVGPPSDVYALGVVLFRVLTGRLPFDQTDPRRLARSILIDRPPSLRALLPSAHEDLVWVVERCLQKDPKARFADGTQLCEVLVALAEGHPVRGTDDAARPAITLADRDSSAPRAIARPRREDAKRHFSWTYELSSSPEALWPHVADTDRFNRAVGLAPVVYATVVEEASGDVRRTASNTAVGLDIAWEEHPFEWVREQFHEVRRSYHKGPLSTLWNRVSLSPREGGGTTLVHDISLDPRGLVGTLAAFLEIERRLAGAMRKVYAHIDEVAQGNAIDADAFEPPHKLGGAARATIAEGEARLLQQGLPPSVVGRLVETLRFAPSAGLAKLRPLQLADRWATPRDVTLDVFLHAADAGLLDIAWDLVCPRCRVAHDRRGSLAQLARTGRCSACAEAYESDLLTSVELVFRPQQGVRSVPDDTYCIGAPARRPHILAQLLLAPGETRSFELELGRGSHRFFGSRRLASPEVLATAVAFGDELTVWAREGRMDLSREGLRAGPVRVQLVNELDCDCLFRLESAPGGGPTVSAAEAMVHPTFRELFGQLLSRGEHFSVSHSALLFVGPAQLLALFRHLGDAAAVTLLADFETALVERARRAAGVVVQQAQGVFLALFPSLVAALEVARSTLEASGGVPGGVHASVHGGRVLALGRPSGIDFSGATVVQARALLDEASPRSIALSEAVLRDARVRELVSPLQRRHHGATLPALAGMRVTQLPIVSREAPAELVDETKVEGSRPAPSV